MFKQTMKLMYLGLQGSLKFFLLGKFLTGQTGARLLETKEVDNMLSSWHRGLLIDGLERKLTERASFQNICVVAPVGTGKTTRYVVPNVLSRAKEKCSMVVNDPKGEIFNFTSGYMQRHGFRVIFLDPEDLAHSARFNPLLGVKDDIHLEQIAHMLVKAQSKGESKDPFWDDTAIRLISFLLKLLRRAEYADEGYNTLGNLYYLLQNMGGDGKNLHAFVTHYGYDPIHPKDTALYDEWQAIENLEAKALQNVVASALTALKAFTNHKLVGLTSSSSFDLGDIRKEKTIIYFKVPAQHSAYYGFWTSIFFSSVFNMCMEEMPDKRTLPLYCLYDEFAHSTLPNFSTVATTIRGYKVSISIILQTISQLKATYGSEALSIQGGLQHYLTYQGSDYETASFFSSMAGNVVETQRERLDSHRTYRQEYALLPVQAIRTIKEDEAIFLASNNNPAKIKATPYFKNRRMKKIPDRYGKAHIPQQPRRKLKKVWHF